jgi:hypothetical protein
MIRKNISFPVLEKADYVTHWQDTSVIKNFRQMSGIKQGYF